MAEILIFLKILLILFFLRLFIFSIVLATLVIKADKLQSFLYKYFFAILTLD